MIEDVSGLFNKNNKFKTLATLSLDKNKIKNISINCAIENLYYLSLAENLI
jgi:hypothetical protein